MLGQVPYPPTYAAMQDFTAARSAETPDRLWICEHPPVFTLGLASRAEHLLATGDIAVVATNRGGQVTYHGPGQVVAYPLVGPETARLFRQRVCLPFRRGRHSHFARFWHHGASRGGSTWNLRSTR
jgi:lipoyl(octanoyl) transferase